MTFDDLKNRFEEDAGKFNGLNATVKFDFKEDGFIVLDATTTPPTVSTEEAETDCTIKISLQNFEKMATGKLDPVMAFTLGKLKVQGSMGIAMKLTALMED